MVFSPEGMDPALAAQFARIRQNFVGGLDRRACEIDNAANPAALQDALHRLTGAAGAYGFDNLSQLARAAMQAAQDGDAARQQAALASLKHAMAVVQAESVP